MKLLEPPVVTLVSEQVVTAWLVTVHLGEVGGFAARFPRQALTVLKAALQPLALPSAALMCWLHSLSPSLARAAWPPGSEHEDCASAASLWEWQCGVNDRKCILCSAQDTGFLRQLLLISSNCC